MIGASPVVQTPASILIVDDDLSICETLARWLVRRGFVIEWRTSVQEVLALVEAQDFDVVITDLHMGEVDGLALCEKLLRLRPGLSVLITTGFGTSETRVAALRAGAHEFLTKPYDLDTLRLAIDLAVADRAVARQRLTQG